MDEPLEKLLLLVAVLIVVILAILIVLVCAGFGVLIGVVRATVNYFRAAVKNINFTSWTWERDDEPAQRSYFFGPGYVQLLNTLKEAFCYYIDSAKWFESISEPYRDKIGFTYDGSNGYISICASAFYIGGFIGVYVGGIAVMLIIAGTHLLITAIVMLVIYVIFSIVRLTDEGFLFVKGIFSLCPKCKHKSKVPFFVCPTCSSVHKKLFPNPYGIFKHRCNCGTELPATFFNGRSKLEAHCPLCTHTLVSSDSRPVVIQLVGGTDVGKTVYLSAFFHLIKERLDALNSIKWYIPEDYQPHFDILEMYFSGVGSSPTTTKNAQLYPIILQNISGTDRQFSMFDVSGEMFDGSSGEGNVQQKQFHYCNGFVFMIDPFCADSLLKEGEDPGNAYFSNVPLEGVVNTFLNYLLKTGGRSVDVRNSTPLAIVIGKCDVEGVRDVLSIDAIKKKCCNHEDKNWNEVRDSVCRQFLMDIGLSNGIENLEASFSNVHYFPISAMGHSQNNEKYEPWGVMEPVDWIITESDEKLSNTLVIH